MIMGQIINFPLRPTPGDQGQNKEGAMASEPLTRVMHVDDDEDIRTIAKMTLELIGEYTVEQFSSGREAIAGAAAFDPQLILLDVMMPDMSGLETWEVLRQIPGLEGVPVAFMTAKAERRFAQGLVDKGAAGVIFKPFDPALLCQKMESIWAGDNTVS